MGLTKRELEVLATLESLGGTATTEQIAKRLRTTINGTGQVLGALRDKKKIEPVEGKRKNALWSLAVVTVRDTLNIWARRILEHPAFCPEGVDTDVWYKFLHDDSGGNESESIAVLLDKMGDVRLTTGLSPKEFRFRGSSGGTMSLRMHAALRMVLLAAYLDAKEGRLQG